MRSYVNFSFFATAIVLSAVSGCLIAADSPLDFAYRVTGSAEVRPLLVFNDGADTFIQPQDPADKSLTINGMAPVRQGPYFVVRGVGGEITIAQGSKASARIAYTRPLTAKPQMVPVVATEAAVPAVPPKTVEAPKASVCQPRREHRDSAFVATFKAGTSTLSALAKAEIKKFIGDASSITRVDVVAEGVAKMPGQMRAESIKSALTVAGIDEAKVNMTTRASTGIGSEIHIHRTIEIPCGAGVVRMPSRNSRATVVWDRDAKELAERIAAELKVKFTVAGVARQLPVQVAAVDLPFAEVMQRIGQSMDVGADLILRGNELILSFKEKQ